MNEEKSISFKINKNKNLSSITCHKHGTPKAWIGSRSSYNNGTLWGTWLDCTQGADELAENIQIILNSAPIEGEDYIICDSLDFYNCPIGESEGIKDLSELAEAIIQHGESFAIYYSEVAQGDLTYALYHFEDRYYGEYRDRDTFGYEYAELKNYISDRGKNPLIDRAIAWDLADWVNDELAVNDFDIFDGQNNTIFVFWKR